MNFLRIIQIKFLKSAQFVCPKFKTLFLLKCNIIMPRIPKKRKLETPNQLDEAICTLEASQLEVDLFFKTLKDLYINDQLCDISFKVGNQQFRAHRVVLASANNFLGAMILSGMQESEMPIIEIQEEAHLFKYILDYIYGVRVELPSSDIISLLGLANHYSMVNLRDKLGEMLANNLTVKNCCTIYAAAGLVSTFLFYFFHQ
jgi:hypothetical protein